LILPDNLRIKKSPEAFNWYCWAAEIKRNPDAMTKPAWIYFGGECSQHRDKERGFKWFKLAYEAGSAAAGRLLAIVTCGVTEQLKMKAQAFAFYCRWQTPASLMHQP